MVKSSPNTNVSRPDRGPGRRSLAASGSFTRVGDKENGSRIIHHAALSRSSHSIKPFKLTSGHSQAVVSIQNTRTNGVTKVVAIGSSPRLLNNDHQSSEPLTPSSSTQLPPRARILGSGGGVRSSIGGRGQRRKAASRTLSPSPPPIETLRLTPPTTKTTAAHSPPSDPKSSGSEEQQQQQNESSQTTPSSSSTCSNSFLEEGMLDYSLAHLRSGNAGASATTPLVASPFHHHHTPSPPGCRPDCMDPVAWTLFYKDGREDVDFLQQLDHHQPAQPAARSSPAALVLRVAQPPSNLTKPLARRAVAASWH